MLKLTDVQKNYGDFSLRCSMEIKPGCVTGLVGANGAGKSTTFKSILNLITIEGGEIMVFGKDYSTLNTKDKEDIGVVLGKTTFSSYLTISNFLPVMGNLYRNFDKNQFVSQCRQFKLPMNKKIKEFSTGMRARLNLLIAMSHSARLLILDEPTAGLDVIARDELLDMLRHYMSEGERSILISSHISSDLEGLCDDIYIIHKGDIVFHEDTDILMDQFGLLKVSEKELDQIDKSKIMYMKKESYGYQCLTAAKQFYIDNYPGLVVEKSGIDDFITIIERGEKR